MGHLFSGKPVASKVSSSDIQLEYCVNLVSSKPVPEFNSNSELASNISSKCKDWMDGELRMFQRLEEQQIVATRKQTISVNQAFVLLLLPLQIIMKQRRSKCQNMLSLSRIGGTKSIVHVRLLKKFCKNLIDFIRVGNPWLKTVNFMPALKRTKKQSR